MKNKIKQYIKDRSSFYLQSVLWLFGYNWHNTVRDECTPDFSCCANIHTSFRRKLVTLCEEFKMKRQYNKYFREVERNGKMDRV